MSDKLPYRILFVANSVRALTRYTRDRAALLMRIPDLEILTVCGEPFEELVEEREGVIYIHGGKSPVPLPPDDPLEIARANKRQSHLAPSNAYKMDGRFISGLFDEMMMARLQVQTVEVARTVIEDFKPHFILMAGGCELPQNIFFSVGEKMGVRCYRILSADFMVPKVEGNRYWFCENNYMRLGMDSRCSFGYDRDRLADYAEELIDTIGAPHHRIDVSTRELRGERAGVGFSKRRLMSEAWQLLHAYAAQVIKGRKIPPYYMPLVRFKALANYLRNKKFEKNLPDLPRPFFLFPLNVVEDAQLLMRGPQYRDLLTGCQMVANVLPFGAHLVIREHPGAPGTLDHYRLKTFLRQNKNVHFLSGDLPMWEVLDHTDAMVTYNSTSALEALSRGIPVVTLGECFYRGTGASLDVEAPLDLQYRLTEALNGHSIEEQRPKVREAFMSLLDECVPEPGKALMTAEEEEECVIEGIIAKLRSGEVPLENP